MSGSGSFVKNVRAAAIGKGITALTMVDPKEAEYGVDGPSFTKQAMRPAFQLGEELKIPAHVRIAPDSTPPTTMLSAATDIVFTIEMGTMSEVESARIEFTVVNGANNIVSMVPPHFWFTIEELADDGNVQTSFSPGYAYWIMDVVGKRAVDLNALSGVGEMTSATFVGPVIPVSSTHEFSIGINRGLLGLHDVQPLRPDHMKGRYQIVLHTPSEGCALNTSAGAATELTVTASSVQLVLQGWHKPEEMHARRDAVHKSDIEHIRFGQPVVYSESVALAASTDVYLSPRFKGRAVGMIVTLAIDSSTPPSNHAALNGRTSVPLGDDAIIDVVTPTHESLTLNPLTWGQLRIAQLAHIFPGTLYVTTHTSTALLGFHFIPFSEDPVGAFMRGVQSNGTVPFGEEMQIRIRPGASFTPATHLVTVTFLAIAEVEISHDGTYSPRRISDDTV